jgi:Serine dehydrogenase proteinase
VAEDKSKLTSDYRPSTYKHLMEEVYQGHVTRIPIYNRLERALGARKKVKVIAYFASFGWHGLLDDTDADMLEEVLQNSCLKNDHELVLVISSPGGSAVAAERMVNVCRSFGNKQFSVIIPKMAKSAATMVCLGAMNIGMSKTSELGPIDPQIPVTNDRGQIVKYLAAHEIIESYNELMKKASTSKGNTDPYLQQLARYDARDIRAIRSAQDLSESIAVNCLKYGAWGRLSRKAIKKRIAPFLRPRFTTVHERPIYYSTVKKCGFNVTLYPITGEMWRTVWELYVRLNWVVTHKVPKIIESADNSFVSNLVE